MEIVQRAARRHLTSTCVGSTALGLRASLLLVSDLDAVEHLSQSFGSANAGNRFERSDPALLWRCNRLRLGTRFWKWLCHVVDNLFLSFRQRTMLERVKSKDIVAKRIYVFSNPVSFGLVGSLEEWPGANTTPTDMDRPGVTIARPKGFFREKGPVPASALLRVCLPARLDMNVFDRERSRRDSVIATM